MRNIKVTACYRGTKYHGFQRQNNAVTIQQIIEDNLSVILGGQKVVIQGCSRTDTGVHALEYCFSFQTEREIPLKGIERGLNSALPKDISILSCEEVDEDFHARFSCKGKEYIYKLHCSESPNPFMQDLAYHYRRKFNLALMQEECKAFIGTHDFKAFCSTGSDKDITVRTIYDFTVEQNGTEVIMRVSGDGFLYNMVRIMVGTLLWINEGKIPAGTLADIIESKDRGRAGKTALACGLYLNKVFY
ncbi:MAG: tRNA pseudouridine(38-40) synthase TruA [Ruminococcus sp.]|nr:tRNA pseudouridine(38-40) synthase TruA [Ruminococcus sp.]